MDPTRFDAVAKTLAGPDRRRVLRLLAGALLGGALALPGERVAAACRRSRDCGRREVCRNRACVRACGNPGTCNMGFTFGCAGKPHCYCAQGRGGEGDALCVMGGGACPTVGCAGDDDCGQGEVCANGCCGVSPGGTFPESVCLPKCR